MFVLPDSPTAAEMGTLFPIHSQTPTNDMLCLLGAMRLARRSGSYSYLEIGSFLGGSLTPFLMDPTCTSVVSIDDRGRIQPDERGISFDYSNITTQNMLDELHRRNLNTNKLRTFDGSIHRLRDIDSSSFDLAFIDGEHTDEACFRDFLWTLPLVKENSIVLFHDSALVYKALRLMMFYLDKEGRRYTFYKRLDSEMSAVLLGDFCRADHARDLGPQEEQSQFFTRAEALRIKTQFKNRARIRFAPNRLLTLRVPISLDIEPTESVAIIRVMN
jgi:predicted O-methyltransferase YrrM